MLFVCFVASNPCHEPKEEGEGSFHMIRYYFDRVQNQCMPFNFKGTKGNRNNFLSKTVCEVTTNVNI